LAINKQTKVLTKAAEQVLELLGAEKFFSNFYLAGGTALALQIFHRKSVDLDFFTSKNFNPAKLKQNITSVFKQDAKIREIDKGTLHLKIKSVKVSFLEFHYPLIEIRQPKYLNVALAGLKDIAAMKLSAVHGRGAKKDFIDVYFLLKEYFSLPEILSFYKQKFNTVNEDVSLLFKSLVYFESAEEDPDLVYLRNVKWENETLKYSKKYFI
jgi:predicted nucleotidyltransferase component of viral defense system